MTVKNKKPAIEELLKVMAKLRSPEGCPWDKEQDHRSIRYHAVEEVYELIDAIEADDDHEMEEELGDLLLQVVFHAQLGKERGVFDFEKIARHVTDKLIRRHPHVFGNSRVKTVDAVWAQWEKIKHTEKQGTRHERPSVLDGIPKHLPALSRAEKLVKKARKHNLIDAKSPCPASAPTKVNFGRQIFELTAYAQSKGWSAEGLLRAEVKKREKDLKRKERRGC